MHDYKDIMMMGSFDNIKDIRNEWGVFYSLHICVVLSFYFK